MDPFPPDRRARRPGLGKLWLGILLALISVGAVGYFVYHNLLAEDSGSQRTSAGEASSGRVSPAPGSAMNAPANSVTSRDPGRSETILTCTAVDGTVFYTNASRCEDADLETRVSEVPALQPLPQSRPTCLGAQSGGPVAHGFLAVCKEPFNKALALEPFLLESDDPASSRAGQRYCAFITEGVQAGCMATSAQFCFLDICQAQREAEQQ